MPDPTIESIITSLNRSVMGREQREALIALARVVETLSARIPPAPVGEVERLTADLARATLGWAKATEQRDEARQAAAAEQVAHEVTRRLHASDVEILDRAFFILDGTVKSTENAADAATRVAKERDTLRARVAELEEHVASGQAVEAHAELRGRLDARIRSLKEDIDAVAGSLGVESTRGAILRTIERVRGDIKRKDGEWSAMRDERDEARRDRFALLDERLAWQSATRCPSPDRVRVLDAPMLAPALRKAWPPNDDDINAAAQLVLATLASPVIAPVPTPDRAEVLARAIEAERIVGLHGVASPSWQSLTAVGRADLVRRALARVASLAPGRVSDEETEAATAHVAWYPDPAMVPRWETLDEDIKADWRRVVRTLAASRAAPTGGGATDEEIARVYRAGEQDYMRTAQADAKARGDRWISGQWTDRAHRAGLRAVVQLVTPPLAAQPAPVAVDREALAAMLCKEFNFPTASEVTPSWRRVADLAIATLRPGPTPTGVVVVEVEWTGEGQGKFAKMGRLSLAAWPSAWSVRADSDPTNNVHDIKLGGDEAPDLATAKRDAVDFALSLNGATLTAKVAGDPGRERLVADVTKAADVWAEDSDPDKARYSADADALLRAVRALRKYDAAAPAPEDPPKRRTLIPAARARLDAIVDSYRPAAPPPPTTAELATARVFADAMHAAPGHWSPWADYDEEGHAAIVAGLRAIGGVK